MFALRSAKALTVAVEPLSHRRAVANAESEEMKAVMEGTKSNALMLGAVVFANKSSPPIVRRDNDSKVGMVK